MLASPPVRAAGERVGGLWAAFGAAALCSCAVFFGGGLAEVNAPLVWIGALALLLAAVLAGFGPLRLDRPAAVFLSSLFGLAIWAGVTTIWSISADRSWTFTNRTLVYAAFGLIGVVVGRLVTRERLAESAALLVGGVAAWALLAKCVPALYSDYGRLARLRAPLSYWNELALLCTAGVPLALWLGRRRRTAGVVLLYALVVTVLLTYSRFGVALACLAAAAWVLLDRDRVESLAAVALGGGVGAAVFGIALALPGITKDGQPRSVRAHDGWIFALVVIAGALLVAVAARFLARHPVAGERRARVERAAGLAALVVALAGLAVSIAFAGHIWKDFTNPASAQINSQSSRYLSANSSNRWTWWQEAWHAFTRHPLGGTGAGTFILTDRMLRRSPITTEEPHNVPLQFLSELGIVGFLLYLGVAGAALRGVVRTRGDPASLAVGIAVAVFFAHAIVDFDWNFVATCGPLLFLAGALLARPRAVVEEQPVRRPLVAVAAVAVALAGIYSLAAPWLAQRDLPATSLAQAKRAHSYDPLSVTALTDWAAYEDAAGNTARAAELYREAVAREPENAQTWYDLGSFYFDYKAWALAYAALNNSYTYDRFGPASTTCGLLDQARTRAFNFTPAKLLKKCPGLRRSSSP
jgi:tetratricopeptide (TPR) repeat protein